MTPPVQEWIVRGWIKGDYEVVVKARTEEEALQKANAFDVEAEGPLVSIDDWNFDEARQNT
jgi:hypothetical protein